MIDALSGLQTGPRRRLANDPNFKHHGAASFLERRFAEYLDTEDDNGPLAASYPYGRTIFGGRFPTQTTQEISGASYAGRTQRSHLPATMPFAVCFYAVALKGRLDPNFAFVADENEKDGRGDATDVARGLYELWYDELLKDLADQDGLRRLVQDAAVLNIETGDADSVGNPLIDETGRRLLIVYRANLLVTF